MAQKQINLYAIKCKSIPIRYFLFTGKLFTLNTFTYMTCLMTTVNELVNSDHIYQS